MSGEDKTAAELRKAAEAEAREAASSGETTEVNREARKLDLGAIIANSEARVGERLRARGELRDLDPVPQAPTFTHAEVVQIVQEVAVQLAQEAPTRTTLTEKELAARWGVHPEHVARLRRSGKLPVQPIPGLGRRILYRLADVERFDGGDDGS